MIEEPWTSKLPSSIIFFGVSLYTRFSPSLPSNHPLHILFCIVYLNAVWVAHNIVCCIVGIPENSSERGSTSI